MASTIAPPPLQQGEPPPSRPPDQYEALIDLRLHQTQRQVKGVDIAAGLLTLAAGALAYLFVTSLIDHWVVPGGLGFWGRLLFLVVLLAAGGVYFALNLLPLLMHRISPLFAAYTIEQSRPSLKNGLINLLCLRKQRAEIEHDLLAKRIYQGLERTTAADVARVSVDTAVDRSHAIRLGYVLAGILAICALYLVISPKNVLTSCGRVLWPWAGIAAPTRVTIDRVEPGDQLIYQGDYAAVSAQVRGLKADESVLLYYSTADGQSLNQAIPLIRPEGEYRHRCQLPPGAFGLQQETTYYIVAGDCRTRPYRLEVQPALTIQIEAVDYRYPEYTGLPPWTMPREGDIRAIEGTEVTIHATASHPIDQASIVMDGNPRFAVKMKPDGVTATGRFTLAMIREKKQSPRAEHESYQLHFVDRDGRENRRPIRYRIEVIPDLAPEVRLVDPPPDQARVPVDGALDFRVHAEDPDFGLRHVALRMDQEGKSLPVAPLLNKVRPDKPHQGPFEGAYRFVPAKLGLKAGDKVVYLAEAADNREPAANHSDPTEPRTMLIVPPENRKPPEGQPRESEKNAGRGSEGEKDSQANKAEQPQDNPSAEKSPEQEKSPNPAKTNPQEKSDQPQKPEKQDRQTGDPQPGNQDGQGNQPGSQAGKPQTGDASKKQDPSSSQQPQSGQDSKPKDPAAGSEQTGDQGQSQDGGQNSGQKGDKQAGKQSEEPRQPIDPQSQAGDAFDQVLKHRAEQQKQNGAQPEQKPPEKNPRQSDQQQPGQKQPGQQKPGQPQPSQPGGQQQSGKDQAGQNQEPGAKQPGTDQAGKPTQSDQKQPGGQPSSQQPGPEQPGSEPNAGQQGAGQRQPGETQAGKPDPGQQPGAQNPDKGSGKDQAGQKGQAGQQPGQKQPAQKKDGQDGSGERQQTGGQEGAKGSRQQSPGGESKPPQQAEPQTTDAQRGQPQQTPDNDPAGAKKADRKDSPDSAQGMQSKGPGKPDQKDEGQQKGKSPSSGSERPNQRGGDPEGTQGSAGAGKPPNENKATPSPQEANREQPKKPGGGEKKPSDQGESATSPSNSPRSSNSQGDTGGDRSGGGEQGGGQASKQSGTGTAGTHSAAEQGGAQSKEPGEGETGTKGGDQVQADRPTGRSASKGQGPGSGQKESGTQQPGKQPQDQTKAEPSGGQPGESNQAGKSQSVGQDPSKPGQQGAGNPTGGGMPGSQQADPATPPPQANVPGEEHNREFAEKQTSLALEYLKDQLAKEKPDQALLDRLGWTRQDMEKFVQRWETMRRAAAQQSPAGETAEKAFHEALKSLGLRPQGTQLRGGQGRPDELRNLKDSGRFEPPPEWKELLRAYHRGVAGSKE